MLQNLINVLTVQDAVWLAGVGVAGISTLVQTLSKKYKPWTWLAVQIGRAVNKEMMDKIDVIETKVNNLEIRDKEQDENAILKDAITARRRILRFSDEIRRKDLHSEEYFNDVMDDITFYEKYCHDHPEFENQRAVAAIKLVTKTYEKCLSENSFL